MGFGVTNFGKMVRVSLAIAVCAAVSFSASAQTNAGDKSEYAKSQLLLGAVETKDGYPVLQAAVQITLAEGWKIYWRNPGDAGLPMTMTADNSENVSEITQLWPAPTRFQESWGLEVFGYKKEVTLPVLLTLKQEGVATTLNLVADYSICKDICIPYKETLTKEIPAKYTPNKKEATQITRALKKVPVKDGSGALTIDSLEWKQETGKGGTLTITVHSKNPLAATADLFAETAQNKGFRFPKPIIKSHNRKAGYKTTFTFAYEKSAMESLAGQDLIVTLVSGDQSVEVALKVPSEVQKKG